METLTFHAKMCILVLTMHYPFCGHQILLFFFFNQRVNIKQQNYSVFQNLNLKYPTQPPETTGSLRSDHPGPGPASARTASSFSADQERVKPQNDISENPLNLTP